MTTITSSLPIGLHYPQMVFRNGRRYLWNTLKKRTFQIRPEERVRLRVVEFLKNQAAMPASRITTEAPVPSRLSRGRTDILCYDRSFKVWLLIECKSEHIPPGPGAAVQSAQYNRHIRAPYIMLTNGICHSLYHIESQIDPLHPDHYPQPFLQLQPFYRTDPAYWKDRGFLPDAMTDRHAARFAAGLSALYQKPEHAIRWLSPPVPDMPAVNGHYYLIEPMPSGKARQIAVSLAAADKNRCILTALSDFGDKAILLCFQLSEKGDFHSPVCYLSLHTETDLKGLIKSSGKLETISDADLVELNQIWKLADGDGRHFKLKLMSYLEKVIYSTV